MSREVDSIIAYNNAGNTGCYAAYTTNGKHGEGSYHHRMGTLSASGDEGLAVDFNAPNNNPEKLLKCAQHFLKQAPLLFELFHSPLGRSVKRGRIEPFIISGHNSHVHVAVNKGTFLPVPSEPEPKPELPSEEDGMADALVVTYPSGAKTIATPDGSIFNAGTPFYGSMHDLKPQDKQGIVSIKALTAMVTGHVARRVELITSPSW
jgi:hypothetical protein